MPAFRSVVSVLVRSRCLLFRASRRGYEWRACGRVGDLSGGVAIEAAQDVELGQALFGAPLDIGPGRWVAAHPDQGDAPQGVVGPPVAAAIEPVAIGAARGGGDRGGATPGARRRLRSPAAGDCRRR